MLVFRELMKIKNHHKFTEYTITILTIQALLGGKTFDHNTLSGYKRKVTHFGTRKPVDTLSITYFNLL